jgi:hypothetical protein
MEAKRDHKNVLDGKPHVTRSVGKARAKWEDIVQTDVPQSVGLRDCKRRAGGSEEWRCLLR